MYAVSDTIKNAFANTNQQYVEMTSDKISITDANIVQGSFKYDGKLLTGDTIEVGTMIASEIDFTLTNHNGEWDDTKLKGVEFLVKIGVYADDGTKLDAIPIGYFTANTVEKSQTTIKVVCYDRMTKFDTIAVPVQNISIKLAITDALTNCGVETDTDLDKLTNADEIVDFTNVSTYRELMQEALKFAGVNGWFGRDGKLVIGLSNNIDFNILASNRYSHEVDESSVSVSGVLYYGSGNSSVYGDISDYPLTIQNSKANPYDEDAIDRIIKAIYTELNDFTYLPVKTDILPAPYLDLGDMPLYDGQRTWITEISYGLNTKTTLVSSGKKPDKNSTNISAGSSDTGNNDYIKFLSVSNVGDITVKDGSDVIVLDSTFVVTKLCHVAANVEILLSADTTEEETDENYVENDLVAKATYYLDNAEIDWRHPKETYQDGVHILSLTILLKSLRAGIHTFKVGLNCSGGSATVLKSEAYGWLMGTGLSGDSAWDGRITVIDEVARIVSELSNPNIINDEAAAWAMYPIGITKSEDVKRNITPSEYSNSVSESVSIGDNIMVYRPGVNEYLVTLTDCASKDNSWVSTKDGATIVVQRLYGIKSISGICDADVTFAFSPDGTRWMGYNAIVAEIQDDYEMSWSIVKEMTPELWKSFDQYWLRATIPNGKKLTQLSVEGGYVQYTVTYMDGSDDGVTYKVGYGVKTPVYKNGGTPSKTDYTFTGWVPEIETTVTKDSVYTAQWLLSVTELTINFDESYKGLQYTLTSESGEENYEGIVDDGLSETIRLQRLDTKYFLSVGNHEETITTGDESGEMEVNINADTE